MFVRFRTTPRRLQVSILEAHRAGTKVTNEHVASLGSIAVPMSVGGRQAFWADLWERLARLSNRIGPDDQAKIRNAVHARIPMVLPEEANADEAAYWATYSAMSAQKAVEKRHDATSAIEEAEYFESVAATFAENRAAALQGDHAGRMLVGKMYFGATLGEFAEACRTTPADGTPIVMANGEIGTYRTIKRPNRNDRRRRRNGLRFTPQAVKGCKPSSGGNHWRVATPEEIEAAKAKIGPEDRAARSTNCTDLDGAAFDAVFGAVAPKEDQQRHRSECEVALVRRAADLHPDWRNIDDNHVEYTCEGEADLDALLGWLRTNHPWVVCEVEAEVAGEMAVPPF
jgi:hypothetical protein